MPMTDMYALEYYNNYWEPQFLTPNPIVDNLEIAMGGFEECLDHAGAIPAISTASGAIRGTYGLMQLVTAFSIRIIGAFGEIYSSDEDRSSWKLFNARADMHIVEGLKNIGRGLVEMIPVVNVVFWLNMPKKADQIEKDKTEIQTSPYLYVGVSSKSVFDRQLYWGEVKRIYNRN